MSASAALCSVLGDDDLLREILLRVGLPTSLLRAALVCKRWYRHASDPAFLRRFGDRHPSRLLGVYLHLSGPHPRFFPIRPHPELAAVARRAGTFFDDIESFSAFVHDSRGGRLLVTTLNEESYDRTSLLVLCSPMSIAGNAVIVKPPPIDLTSPDLVACLSLPPDVGDGRSYLSVLLGFSQQQTTVSLYELQDMRWVTRASVTAQLPVSPTRFRVRLFDDSKFYMLTTCNKILVCDFPSSTISAMELPIGVENDSNSHGIMLSRGNGSGLYLTHVKGSLLHFFYNNTAGNWFLVQSICLRAVSANLGMADWSPVDGVKICAVGDNAKFVFLEMFGTIIFLDATSKQAEKVYVLTPDDVMINVHPLMLIWPPVFPQLKKDTANKIDDEHIAGVKIWVLGNMEVLVHGDVSPVILQSKWEAVCDDTRRSGAEYYSFRERYDLLSSPQGRM